VADGHPLHGQPVAVIGKSEASDDIVIELAAGGWAQVHLTWKGGAETPPWPKTKFYDTVQDLERDLHESD
jgi:cation diffusion facilitator CzcD-associated flavoprotein CzcO